MLEQEESGPCSGRIPALRLNHLKAIHTCGGQRTQCCHRCIISLTYEPGGTRGVVARDDTPSRTLQKSMALRLRHVMSENAADLLRASGQRSGHKSNTDARFCA